MNVKKVSVRRESEEMVWGSLIRWSAVPNTKALFDFVSKYIEVPLGIHPLENSRKTSVPGFADPDSTDDLGRQGA